jgi:hypothetical protein
MCGRYTLRANPSAVAEEFDLPEVTSLRPRFNIAPDQPVAVVRFDPNEGARRLDFLTWGLVPFWADDPGIGDRLNNQPRPEAVVLGRPPEGAVYVRLPPLGAGCWEGPVWGRPREVAPVGGGLSGRPRWGRWRYSRFNSPWRRSRSSVGFGRIEHNYHGPVGAT